MNSGQNFQYPDALSDLNTALLVWNSDALSNIIFSAHDLENEINILAVNGRTNHMNIQITGL